MARSGGRLAIIAVVAAYAISRAAYAGFGVRFLYLHAHAYHHFIDRPALEEDLLGSLWYDHAQPPGLNLLWGAAVRLSPDHPDRVLWPVFLVVGLAIAIGLLQVARSVGLGERAATAVAVLWTVSPGAVLLETYFFYTPLEILGVIAVAVGLARWSRTGSPAAAAAALAAASALGLTRASFHLVWIVGLILLMGLARRDGLRTLALASLIPLLAVGGWYTKNLILFDGFGVTSLTGGNLNRITTEQIDLHEREGLVAAGELSPYAVHPAFSTFEDMGLAPTERREPEVRSPVLDDLVRRGAPGFGNIHHRDYLDVFDARMDDSTWTLRNRPGAYMRGVSRSTSLTFRSTSDFFGYGPNADRIAWALTVERAIGGGAGDRAEPGDASLGTWGPRNHEWLVLGAYLAVMVAVPARLWTRRAWKAPVTSDVVVAYLWGTTLYLTLLGILVEFGENNRFRSVTDPLVLVLAASLVSAAIAARREPRVTPEAGPPPPEPA